MTKPISFRVLSVGLAVAVSFVASLSSGETPAAPTKKDSAPAGELEPAHEEYWFNGRLRLHEPMKGGLREGLARYYFPNGRLYAEIPYTEDMKEGRFSIHRSDGTLAEEQEWHDDLLNGELRKFHSNGRIAESSYYVDGERHGPAVWFDEKGQISATGVYEEGLLVAGSGTGSLQQQPAVAPAPKTAPKAPVAARAPQPPARTEEAGLAFDSPAGLFESLKERGVLRIAMPVLFLIGLGCIVYVARLARREELVIERKILRNAAHWSPEAELLAPIRRAGLIPESFPVLFVFLLPLLLSFGMIAVYRSTWGFLAAVAVGLLGTLGLYASLASQREREKSLVETGVPIAARLVAKDPEKNDGAFVLAYSWDGTDYFLEPALSRFDHPYRVGDVITVLIDPSNPTVCLPYHGSRFEAFPLR